MRRKLMVALVPAILVPLVGFADPGPSLEENRQRLEQWRQDPEHLARLQRNQAFFRRLSPAAQEQLRKLDRDLNEERPGMRARLKGVLERYTAWLDSLSEAERKSIENAPDRKTRLERIRELRQQQWIKRLPHAQQEQIKNAKDKERSELIRKLWQDDLERRADWRAAERNWDMTHRPKQQPVSPATLPPEMQQYYEKGLKPLLNKEEEKRLKEAEGKWPRYPRVLVELADSHPLSVLGPIGPTHIDELGAGFQQKFQSDKKLLLRLKQAEGKWPDFGAVMHDARKGKEQIFFAQKLGGRTPAQLKDFPIVVQQFITQRLLPALSEDEQRAMTRAEEKWPEYPRLIVELARKHNLPIPADPLPGPIDWDRYRARSLSAVERR
jgi:hypothetical protein